MTPTDPILSPERFDAALDNVLCESCDLAYHMTAARKLSAHDAALRARVGALEAERDDLQARYWKLEEAVIAAEEREASAYTRGRESVLAKVRGCAGGWLRIGHGVDTCWFCDAEATAAWEQGVPIHKCEHRPDCLWAEARADPPTRVPPGATLASEEVNPEDDDQARGDVDQRRP
jgi:hypothetical protein